MEAVPPTTEASCNSGAFAQCPIAAAGTALQWDYFNPILAGGELEAPKGPSSVPSHTQSVSMVTFGSLRLQEDPSTEDSPSTKTQLEPCPHCSPSTQGSQTHTLGGTGKAAPVCPMGPN